MNNPTAIAEITGTRQVKCTRCEERYTQTHIGDGKWTPKEHFGCSKAPGDRRAERRDLDENLTREIRERELKQQRELQLTSLRVPPLYAPVTLDNFEARTETQKFTLERAREFALWFTDRADLSQAFPQVVLMVGPTGTGKNHVAWSIAKEVSGYLAPDKIRVANCSDIIRELRESWRSPEAESEVKRLRFYRELELLVIDEVSRHALYGEPSRHLYDLVNHRQEWLRPTILTSNEDMNGIAELLGPALVSRSAGWGGVWKFDGPDYRLELRKRRQG
jgi:DNA replication protein DnaC